MGHQVRRRDTLTTDQVELYREVEKQQQRETVQHERRATTRPILTVKKPVQSENDHG